MYRIILVDDEELFLDGFKKKIDWDSFGFQIIATFQNPYDAIRFLMANPVELIITDIRMPFMDGLTFIREVRIFLPDVPVIVLSGYSEFSYAKEAIKYDVSDYLLKPVSAEELSLTLIRLKENLDEKFNVETNSQTEGYYEKVVSGIKKSVMLNYKTISLESIAVETKLSINYISKIFKKISGQNFSDYLLEVKMINAKRFLDEGNLKIYEIAYMIGYDNPKNFTRAFRNYYGMSPREYKNGEEK